METMTKDIAQLLTDVMHDVWEQAHERDPERAAKEIALRLPESQELLLFLLRIHYSTFLSHQGRLSWLQERRQEAGRAVRRNAPIPPSRGREQAMRELDLRPYFVPSAGEWVNFKDMTVPYWMEYAERRRTIAKGYENSALWAEMIIAKMNEHQVKVSGGLPDAVKREIFTSDLSE